MVNRRDTIVAVIYFVLFAAFCFVNAFWCQSDYRWDHGD